MLGAFAGTLDSIRQVLLAQQESWRTCGETGGLHALLLGMSPVARNVLVNAP